MAEVEFGGRTIGHGHPCFVIAEAGVNHNGDLQMARDLVRIAARAGADAIKFQTFSADRLVTASAPKAEYQVARSGADESQHDMLKRLELSAEDHRRLMADCEKDGILFLSSAFDQTSADLLEELGVVAYKVPSGEITNLPYLEHLAKKGRPLIVSTGMSTMEEIGRALETIGGVPVVLLHCTSLYPSPPEAANLRAMDSMRETFQVPVGYSDHTDGIWISLAAVALGADMIEKHLTIDRDLPGPDHAASLDPAGFRSLVEGVREVETARGDGVKRPLPEEAATAAVARKSIVAATDIPAGTAIRREMLAVMRPGTGLPPDRLDWVIGRKAKRAIDSGSVITEDMV
jgi:N-acetylneuraminate synthase/N,N'-diacetyllegionaminate synthase